MTLVKNVASEEEDEAERKLLVSYSISEAPFSMSEFICAADGAARFVAGGSGGKIVCQSEEEERIVDCGFSSCSSVFLCAAFLESARAITVKNDDDEISDNQVSHVTLCNHGLVE